MFDLKLYFYRSHFGSRPLVPRERDTCHRMPSHEEVAAIYCSLKKQAISFEETAQAISSEETTQSDFSDEIAEYKMTIASRGGPSPDYTPSQWEMWWRAWCMVPCQPGVDQVGVDQVGIGRVGVDPVGVGV